VLTGYKGADKVLHMENGKQKKPRGGEIAAKPIMVYPASPEQRIDFETMRRKEGRSLSNYMVQAAQRLVDQAKADGTFPAEIREQVVREEEEKLAVKSA
jgi:hypothetical protein